MQGGSGVGRFGLGGRLDREFCVRFIVIAGGRGGRSSACRFALWVPG